MAINVAMISSWHVHAPGYAKRIAADDRFKITAVYDERVESGKKWADELGCKFYDDYDELLKNSEIDAVCINSPTNLHPMIIIKAAKAKKHIFTEKVLALTAREAEEIRNAVNQSGVIFAISYFQRCFANLIKAKQLIAEGAIGKVGYMRVRNVHSGSIRNWLPDHFYNAEQCGGGAMIDLGAHPMYLLQWFMGDPVKVSSVFTNLTPRPVEDNAVSVLEFADGAIGVSETGFVSIANPYTVEFSGTEGYIMCEDSEKLTLRTEKKYTVMEGEDLPEAPKQPLEQWLDAVANGTQICHDFGIDEAVRLSKLMEAAYNSHKTNAKAIY